MPTTTQEPNRCTAPEVLTVVIEVDPLRARHGYRIDSAYVEEFWTSIIGPTGIAVLRLIARRAVTDPYRVHFEELGECLGITVGGYHSPVRNGLRRLVRFGAARWVESDESEIAIYSHFQLVPVRLRRRWSAELTARHSAATD